MADAIVAIYEDGVVLGDRRYMNDERVDPVLLSAIKDELAEELAPGEIRAKPVAEAIWSLHQKAMSGCISEPLDSYIPAIEDEVIERCRIALLREINKSKKSKKRKGKRNVH